MRIARSAFATALVAASAAALAAPASAAPADQYVTQNETIDLSGSTIYSDAPVRGGFTAGQFNLMNESAYSLPAGYSFNITWNVSTAPKSAGWNPGYQSYVSTTATPSLASSKVSYGPASNAKDGQNGAAKVTVNKTLAPGLGVYGTWSGANISADGEPASSMNYTVSIEAPSRTMTYESLSNSSDGSLVHITHVVTIKGGTFSYTVGQ